MNDVLAYKDTSLISNYIYFNRKFVNNEYNVYYIYKLNDISVSDGMKDWEVNHIPSITYKFVVPVNNINERRAYLYCESYPILVDMYKDELYIMDYDEFINTYRTFYKNDGKLITSLPNKLIQDK